jgi:hypothetical protein
MRGKLFAALSLLIGFVLAFAVGEIACRMLPVNGGLMAMPVNEADPVFHFTPNRNVTWSRDWNFTIVNHIRVNNAGYVNDQDYDAGDPRPLLAIVGDSYVEAAMVPYRETLQGRLAAALAPAVRVYSFAAAGAPLSQYLVWAREARLRFKARYLVIVIVGNDFDESLAMYKTGPGFHHYVAGADGALALQRFDYAYGRFRILARRSAFVRYLVFNLQAPENLRSLASQAMTLVRPARAETFIGNTLASADADRIRWSQAAVLAFLRDLADYAGWQSGNVLFLIDGIRYPRDDQAVRESYFVRMREFFIAQARRAGYEAVDLDPAFFEHFRANSERFEFPTDGHWNALGHRLATEAALRSKAFSRWQASAAQAAPSDAKRNDP